MSGLCRSRHDCITTQLNQDTTASRHNCITARSHHGTFSSPHACITARLHQDISASACRDRHRPGKTRADRSRRNQTWADLGGPGQADSSHGPLQQPLHHPHRPEQARAFALQEQTQGHSVRKGHRRTNGTGRSPTNARNQSLSPTGLGAQRMRNRNTAAAADALRLRNIALQWP